MPGSLPISCWRSDFPGEPADAPDGTDFIGDPFIGSVEGIVGDDAQGGRIGVRDVLHPFHDQTHAVEQN